MGILATKSEPPITLSASPSPPYLILLPSAAGISAVGSQELQNRCGEPLIRRCSQACGANRRHRRLSMPTAQGIPNPSTLLRRVGCKGRTMSVSAAQRRCRGLLRSGISPRCWWCRQPRQSLRYAPRCRGRCRVATARRGRCMAHSTPRVSV